MNKTIVIVAVSLLIVSGIGAVVYLRRAASPDNTQPVKRPAPQVNIIPISERPYVTLAPLNSRNDVQFTLHNLNKPAESVELALEYTHFYQDNPLEDAAFHHYDITDTPLVETIFLGSKSAGGSITYHTNPIGGIMRLEFANQDYALENPWRYYDDGTDYDQLSTSDGKFQVELVDPITNPKVIVMQSPGLPAEIDGEILTSPYVITTVSELPDTDADISLRLSAASPTATIYGWDGNDWNAYDTIVDDKTLTTTGPLVSTYVAVSQ